jgi:hypothetical protein
MLIRARTNVALATLFGFAATALLGCRETAHVPVIEVPPAKAGETKPVPNDVKKGGGPGSSGNQNRNPGANS